MVAVDGDGSVRVLFTSGPAAAANNKDAKEGEGEEASDDKFSREIRYSRYELRDLIPAWALTVHKVRRCRLALSNPS
jgi:hypothetical protein